MIVTRSPLRITFGGGGTDLPSYYRDHGGFLVAAAIDKYVYVMVTRPFTPGIFLKYSQQEHVDQIDDVQHPIMREAIRMLDFRTPQVEIATLADVPAGTGLGSSGSFTTALLRALHAHRRRMLLPEQLAEAACDIELNRLGQPIGKQDQYIAAYGGLTCFTFRSDGRVDAVPLAIPVQSMFDLEDNLLLFFTGFSRSAGDLLAEQNVRTINHDSEMIDNLHVVKELGLRSKDALERGDVRLFADIMDAQWQQKKRRSRGVTNADIDEWYELGRKHGALGGKLVGAGGGGFLLFYTEEHRRLRSAMSKAGLTEVRFRFDFEGTKVLFA
jgi:D-glycero-alpha-D-manno-heptose-7-phosphate kinase